MSPSGSIALIVNYRPTYSQTGGSDATKGQPGRHSGNPSDPITPGRSAHGSCAFAPGRPQPVGTCGAPSSDKVEPLEMGRQT
jgi:hypothetical protein